MSRGRFKSNNQSGRVLRGCTNKEPTSEVPIYDVDNGKIDYVTIDDAECSRNNNRPPRESRYKEEPHINICIVDDEEGSLSNEAEEDSNSDSTSKASCPSSSCSHAFHDREDDECVVFVKEQKTAQDDQSRREKSGACSTRIPDWDGDFENGMPFWKNCDLSSSESDSGDDDKFTTDSFEIESSDCEIVDDSSGNIRENWQRAASKKGKQDGTHNGPDLNAYVSESGCKSRRTFDRTFQEEIIIQDDACKQFPCTHIFDGGSDTSKLDRESVFRKKENLDSMVGRQMNSMETCNNGPLASQTKSSNCQMAASVVAGDSCREAILGEREKHKESEEFRRAAEEEWAARQEQLRIQAEEVQRLRKRKKAESLRLLEMERRQRQRLEEVRESQKKNEETMNLKEQLRIEVRKQLDLMELQCKDLASLLRGLGIVVNGGHYPSPNEVNAAYRQALLKFHPDRASKTDVRQQVEAEEKFKLISRLKDKLQLTAR